MSSGTGTRYQRLGADPEVAVEVRTAASGDLFAPVTLLRAAAAVLVVHGYLVGLWPHRHEQNPAVLAAVREWLTRPLRLGEDFGPLGIMLLLLATGFAAAAAADHGPTYGRLGDLGWRLVRGYLPVLVGTAVAICAVLYGVAVWTEPDQDTITVGATTVLGNLSLTSHLVPGTALLVPLAWVIGLQLLAWLAGAAARTRPVPVVTAGLALVLALILLHVTGTDLAVLGRTLCFLPLILIGLVTWKVADGALSLRVGLVLGTGCVAAHIGVDQTFDELGPWWYPVAATYAILLFVTAVLVAGRVANATARQPVVRWLADRVEWLLVLTGVVGFPVLTLVSEHVPLGLAVGAAVVATGGAAELCHRLAVWALPSRLGMR